MQIYEDFSFLQNFRATLHFYRQKPIFTTANRSPEAGPEPTVSPKRGGAELIRGLPDTENEARNSRHSPYPHAGNRPERGGPSARRIRFGRGGFLRFGRRTHRKSPTPTGTRAGDPPKESVRRRRARSQTLPQTRDRDHRLHRRTIPGPAARNRRLPACAVCSGFPGSARQDDAYDGRHASDDSVRATDGRPADRRTGRPGGGYGDRERPSLRHRYGRSPCGARFRHADRRHHRLGPSRHHARTAHGRRPGYDRTRRSRRFGAALPNQAERQLLPLPQPSAGRHKRRYGRRRIARRRRVDGYGTAGGRLQPHADGRPWTRDGLRLGRSQSADSDPACPNGMHGRRYRAGNDVGPEPPRRSDRPADSGSRSTHARRRGAAGLLPHRRPDIRRRALRTLGARIRRTFGPAAGTRNGRSRPAASGEPIYETTLIKNKYKIHYPNPMKQFVILFLLFTISPISFTFAQNKIFCEIIEQIVSQKKTRIYLDYGQERNKKKDIRLENENEKAEIFYSRVEALNIMSALGWKFEQAYVKVSGSSGNGYGSTSSTTHYLLSKDVDSIQEINNIIDEIKAKKSELNNIPTESEQRDTNSINKIF